MFYRYGSTVQNFKKSPSKEILNSKCLRSLIYTGTTRNNFDGKKVVQLEYEAYIPMAKKKMLEICQQIRNSWNIEKIAMEHRIG
jgi:molybdopterin synthase catalytic subunit